MNKNKYLFLLIILCVQNTFIFSSQIIQGNDPNPPFGFMQEIKAKVFDQKSGFFFVGLDVGGGNFTLARAARPDFRSVAKFTAIAQNNLINNRGIEFLTLSAQAEKPSLLPLVAQEANPFESKRIIVTTNDGTTVAQVPSDLNDADGNPTQGIINIAAGSDHVFALVRTSTGNFGTPGSGIALMEINKNINGMLQNISIKDATTGLDGNLARSLDRTNIELKGTSGGNDVVFSPDPRDINQAAIYYDSFFDRLYIGLRIQTGIGMLDIGKSVVIARTQTDANDNKRIELQTIVPDSAITAMENELVVAQGMTINLRVKALRVMHASTGPSYLIINGGRGDTDQVGNRIHALPLVDNPVNPLEHGTLADKTAALEPIRNVFTKPATLAMELAIENDPAARVGDGPLPIESDKDISDMVVLGDTVYVSIPGQADDMNDTGIFYSQALFDDQGKIIRWTPWTKRLIPFNAFQSVMLPGEIEHDGRILFFDLDGKTGNTWFIEGTTKRVVGITSWTTKSFINSLPQQVSANLSNSCYSVLDLDQATRGFTGQTVHRYAIFGGVGKVIFARTSQAVNNQISSPQTVITDFSLPENFLVTQLPSPAGCITALEYSRRTQTQGNQNYFFAGTESGLFVFADNQGQGFNVQQLGQLNAQPFSNRTWQKVEQISDAVTAIKTSGNQLYVLTLAIQNDPSKPLASTLLSIPFTNSIDTMFNQARIIAQTGQGIFSNVTEFYGMDIIATGDPDDADPATKEQVILATSQGLFKSNANQMGVNTGIADAVDQDAAQWQFIQNTNTTMFTSIAGIDTPIAHTVFPISVQDQNRTKTFERSSIHQLSGAGNPMNMGNSALISTMFVPQQFNARDAQENLATLDPIIHFFSDGGRRFLILKRVQDPSRISKLAHLPFDTQTFGISSLEILRHPVLENIERFFWTKQIGASGLFLAGTNNGVVSLE